MPDYCRTTVFILTPLIFRYHLTLMHTYALFNQPDPRMVQSLLHRHSLQKKYIR
jgi:hypothetical protein